MAAEALYRERIHAPPAYHALFLVPAAIQWGAVLLGHAPLVVAIAASLVLVLLWALFATMRVTVTGGEIQVRYGLSGPRIPVAAVEHSGAEGHEWKPRDGWGIRYGRDGVVAYDMRGDRGRAVRVVYRRGKKQRTVLLSARDPERLAAAIAEARGQARDVSENAS